MEDFILRAAIAAIGIATITGSLGCFVIWKRMSYFAESISHSALLGISLGIITGLNAHLGLVIIGTIFAVSIVLLQQKKILSNDAILGIFSHIALALGIIILSVVNHANTDYFALLFGDILSITNTDIMWIYAILIVISILLTIFWQRLLIITLNEELAVAQGLNRNFYQLLFMLMIALVVSITVQIVGILLVTSLLIIPPAITKVFTKSTISMMFYSIIIAIIAVITGLGISTYYDLATGPAIVIVLGGLFLLSQLTNKN